MANDAGSKTPPTLQRYAQARSSCSQLGKPPLLGDKAGPRLWRVIVEQGFHRATEAAHGASGIGIPDVLIPNFLHDGFSFRPLPHPFADHMRRLIAHL